MHNTVCYYEVKAKLIWFRLLFSNAPLEFHSARAPSRRLKHSGNSVKRRQAFEESIFQTAAFQICSFLASDKKSQGRLNHSAPENEISFFKSRNVPTPKIKNASKLHVIKIKVKKVQSKYTPGLDLQVSPIDRSVEWKSEQEDRNPRRLSTWLLHRSRLLEASGEHLLRSTEEFRVSWSSPCTCSVPSPA